MAMDSSLQATQRPKRKRSLDASTATACDQCHRCKVRCCSVRPSCERCQRNGSTCTYSLGKPLGKPPKAARRKLLRPNPAGSPRSAAAPGAAQDEDFGFVHLRSHKGGEESGPLPLTGPGNTRDQEMSLGPSMQHELTASHPVSAPYDDRMHLVEHGHGNSLFSPSAGITFFSAAEETDMDLDFLVDNDFSRDSHMHAISASPSNPVPDTVVIVAGLPTSNSKSDPSSRPVAVVTPSPSNYPTPTPCSRLPVTPLSEPVLETFQMSSTPHTRSFSVPIDANKSSPRHPPTLLETISHICSKTPSAAQSSPISEALRLARQGLQAVHQCLPQAQPPASEGSGLDPARSANRETSILACVLLMQQVLSYYESLSHHCPPSAAVASPPPSADAHASPSPFSASHGAHAVEPIRIGDFEVECFASRQLILDAVVTAEKQKARNAVWKLEKWARELVEQGKREGLLAAAFLEPLKRRLDDASLKRQW